MALAFSPGNYRAIGGDGGDPPFTDRVFTGTAATNCTYAMWLRRDADQNDYGTYWGVQGIHYLALITGSNGDNLRLDSNYEASGLDAQNDPTGFLPLTTGTWYYVAVTADGFDYTLYSAELGTSTLTVEDTWTSAVDEPDWTHVGFGTFPQFGIQGEGSIAFYRAWSGVTLTQGQLEAEMASTTPVVTSGLWHDFRFESGALGEDSSGNNYDTNEVVGTGGSFTADPSLVETVNGTTVTAFTFSAPAVGTRTVNGSAAAAFTFSAPAAGTITAVNGTTVTAFTFTPTSVGTRTVFGTAVL